MTGIDQAICDGARTEIAGLFGELSTLPLSKAVTVVSSLVRHVANAGNLYVTLTVDNVARHYVQFIATSGGGVLCETVSNNYLDREHQLSEEQVIELIALGWSSPSPNFMMNWSSPVPAHIAADRMITTLVSVYGVDPDSTLKPRVGVRNGRGGAREFVVRAVHRARTGLTASFGVDGPDQDVFHVEASDDHVVSHFLALVPEELDEDARRAWLGGITRSAFVARDLSWAVPAGRAGTDAAHDAAEEMTDLRLRIGELSELPRLPLECG